MICDSTKASFATALANKFEEKANLVKDIFGAPSKDRNWTENDTKIIESSCAAREKLVKKFLDEISGRKQSSDNDDDDSDSKSRMHKLECILCDKWLFSANIVGHYQAVHNRIYRKLQSDETDPNDPLVGMTWSKYREVNYPTLKGKTQKSSKCPVCQEDFVRLLRHLRSPVPCVPGQEDEIKWQSVRVQRKNIEHRLGAIEYVGCKFCNYPLAIWHTDKKNENYDVFKHHMEENICRSMKGESEDQRQVAAAALLEAYKDGKLAKYDQKSALYKFALLPKDKFDCFDTHELWVQAGKP